MVREPFQVSLDELCRMTEDQINRVYFHPCKEDGTVDLDRGIPAREATVDDRIQAFRDSWTDKGASPEEIDDMLAHPEKIGPRLQQWREEQAAKRGK